MKTTSFVSALALLASLAFTVVPTLAAAKAVFVEPTWDAGEVELGTVIEHDFIVRNEGDQPFEITGVTPTCGCTVADFDPVIQPGKTGRIHARVKTKTLHTGKLAKTITVNTNAPGAERVILTVKMVLTTPLEFLPKPMVYLSAAPGEEKTQEVLARPHRPGMKVVGVRCDSPVFRVSFEPAKPVAKGEKRLAAWLLPREGDYWIRITMPADTPAGIHRGEITVLTNDPGYPEAKLRVSAVVREKR